jgi:hypothetical protein
VDEYSRSGPKRPNAAAEARRRETETQMKELLQTEDEETLIAVLKSRYNLTSRDSRFQQIMQIWHDARQRF